MKTIYLNGNIITMDPNYPEVNAIAIENDKIIFVGDENDILNQITVDDKIIDLNGKTMLPGFIDSHSHFIGFANSLSQCDLSSANNFNDIIKLMKKFISVHQIANGETVVGFNYDHNFLEEKKHPDKFILDQISTKHNILIIHASSHMGVANSIMLTNNGLNQDAIDPVGGKYGRIENSNELNGYLEENAFIDFQTKAIQINPAQLFKLIVKAQDIYASYGITTIQDGMVNEDLFQLLKYASEQNLLKLDVVSYIDINNSRSTLRNNCNYLNHYVNHLKIGGYKTFLDGSPQGGTAWMSKPYLNGDNGYPVLTDQRLYELISIALDDKQQLLAHCNGDQAANQFISQFEKVHNENPSLNLKRPVMIHGQLVRKDQLTNMAKLNMIPSFFVAHTYYWGDIHLANFGFSRASQISPARSAAKLNIPFTFHQDTPVLMPDMLKTVWCAVNRLTKNGVDLGPDEKINRYEALKAITINGAYQYFEEDVKGSIQVGKIADLVILNDNPLTVAPKLIDQIKVLETIKEGKIIYLKDKHPH